MTRNQIELRSVKELERHNRASEQLEQERNRYTEEHYIRSDAAAMSQAGAAWANVEINRINAQTRLYELNELERYHSFQIEYQNRQMKVQEGQLELAKEQWGTESRVKVTNAQTERARVKAQEEANQLRNREIDVDIQKFNATMDYNVWRVQYEDMSKYGQALLGFTGKVVR